MSSKINCPKCRAEILLADVNVAADFGVCRQCGRTWSFAGLLDDTRVENCDLRYPPAGAWYRETSASGFEAGVSTRSFIALILIPLFCVTLGIFPSEIYSPLDRHGNFNANGLLTDLLHLLIVVVFGCMAIMSVYGKVTVTVDGNNGSVFTGVGSIGWRRQFDWRGVSEIRRTQKTTPRGRDLQQITFYGARCLNFAAGVTERRLDFLLAVLRKKWRESDHEA